MIESEKKIPRQSSRHKSRMPENSVFFERVVPGLLILLAIVMLVLILLAAGILFGVVPFK